MLVSATLTRDPARLAGVRLHAPRVLIQSATVDLGERNKSRDSAPEAARYLLPSTLVEKIAVIDSDSKPLALCALIQKIGKDVPIIVFTASVQATHRLFLLLSSMDEVSRDTNPVEYSSFDSQFDRASALASFASGASRLLVASDAATRGLDVHRVGAVISYDAPSHMKTYVHRVGRTARAGRNGVAYTLCRPSEESTFLAMLSKVENRRNGDAPERFVLRDEDVVAFEPSLRSSLVAVKLHLEADSKSAQVEDEERAGSTRAARVAAALACQNFRRGETAKARL
jgi:ATP-dependent RNA helicase DDX51/DBP6